MNFKTTIVLFVLLIVVGGIVFFTNNSSKKPEQKITNPADTTGQKLIDFKSERVNKLVITDSVGKQTALSKDNGNWKLTTPVNASADEYAVQQLVSSLTDLQSQGTPDSAPDAGLDKPRYRVELSTDDGKSAVIKLGVKTGVGDVMYAQVEGASDIQLVPSSLDKTLKTAAVDVRDKHLVKSDSQIQQVRVSWGGKTLALAKQAGKWKILEPSAMPGDESAISTFLYGITGLEATEFIEPDSEDVAFARFNHPTMTVWISTASPSTQPTTNPSTPTGGTTITFGSADAKTLDHYFVQTSDGQIAKVTKSSFDDLHAKTALDLRDKDVATILPGDVTRIAISKETFAPPATQPATEPTTRAANNHGKASADTAGIFARSVIATKSIILIKRKLTPPVLGPAFPTTNPTTQASTQPAPELSEWQVENDPKAQIDDAKVAAMLAKFDPLHADKFLAIEPGSTVTDQYTVEITTQPVGGGATTVYQMEFRVPTGTDSPWASYADANFELPKTMIEPLDADFIKK